jgi:hypothetical protein
VKTTAWLLIVSCLMLMLRPLTAHASDVLEHLISYDKHYVQGATIDVHSIQRPHPLNRLNNTDSIYKIRWTRQGNDAAAHYLLDERTAAPTYPQDPNSFDRRSFSGSGDAITWKDAERHAFSGAELRGSSKALRRYEVDRRGDTSSMLANAPTIALYEPQSYFESSDVYVPMLATGRGYSTLITQVNEVTADSADGMIHVVADGIYPGGFACEWRLVVDPDARYLVRQAEAINSAGQAMARFETVGSLSDTTHPVARSASFIFFPGRFEGRLPTEFIFLAYSNVPDTDLLAVAQSKLTHPYPDGADVLDYRVDPNRPMLYTVGEDTDPQYDLEQSMDATVRSFGQSGQDERENVEATETAATNQATSRPQGFGQGDGLEEKESSVGLARLAFIALAGLVAVLIVIGFWHYRRHLSKVSR